MHLASVLYGLLIPKRPACKNIFSVYCITGTVHCKTFLSNRQCSTSRQASPLKKDALKSGTSFSPLSHESQHSIFMNPQAENSQYGLSVHHAAAAAPSISSGCFSLCWTNRFTSSTESNTTSLGGHIRHLLSFIQKVFPSQNGYTRRSVFKRLKLPASETAEKVIINHKGNRGKAPGQRIAEGRADDGVVMRQNKHNPQHLTAHTPMPVMTRGHPRVPHPLRVPDSISMAI